MQREYDVFEQLVDGSTMWRGHASGLHEARRKLQTIARTTSNLCFVFHMPTQQIVARLNVRAGSGKKPVVFQISYDQNRAPARAEVLKRHGYEVITVIGNEAAKVILSIKQDCDLFLVGHAAPEETRREMVDWLKTNYPGVRILAVNPPPIRELVGADYNVKINGPETLLPVIVTATGGNGGAEAQ